ncbi:MAG: DNA-directed RNA polymerase subunit alpha [Planctomycetota bacterium]|nr:MAG: DNA-directed RNA polymerase subunit alpha [Planctomycetota bacterium]
MRIRWRGFELPMRVVFEEDPDRPNFGRFVVEPFERGFGTTIGNSLRRILLSSLEGAAPVRMRLAGAEHEFTAVDGILEDVTDIVLNVKKLRVKVIGDEPVTLKVKKKGPGPVKAGDLECPSQATIVNPEHHIAEITSEDTVFDLEIEVAKGRGFVLADQNVKPDMPIGTIPLDSLFSPVERVRYFVEETRVGQRTNYDKLTIEIWTDGTISPEMALVEAAVILRKHLNPFVKYFDAGSEIGAKAPVAAPEVAEPEPVITPADVEKERPASSEELLDQPFDVLNLSVRVRNCLEAAGLRTVRDLVRMKEQDFEDIRNFGRASMNELKKKLAAVNLSLGMNA